MLAALIHYFYNFTLRENINPLTGPNMSYFVRVYTIADKYDVPPLRTLAKQRLQRTFNPQTALGDHADFIDTVRAVNEYTPHRLSTEGDVGLWGTMLPVMRSNIAALLQNEAFKELLLELPDLNFRLLAMLDPSTKTEPSVKRERLDSDDEDEDDEHQHRIVHAARSSRFGRGRTLG
jgi:hypothetical protein